ncbi:MAG: single-stranded DNA-binding protein [Planctomycetaceae bacterium]|nr:single-stranded DNA-binding protein [Planctomycetaceae bacterium]
MASLNKVMLMGNMTRDPQLSYLPSQTPVVEFGLAISRKFKKQDGSQGEETCFVDCQMFGKRAEVVNKYFKKGEPIFVEGRLKFDQWNAQDGSKRSKLRVFVENFEFLGKGGGGSGPSAAPADAGGDYAPPEVPYNGGGTDDDIPF